MIFDDARHHYLDELMAMNLDPVQIESRIDGLERGEFQPIQFILQTYGLSTSGFGGIESALTTWAKHNGRRACRDSLWSRWVLEQYFVAFDLIPPLSAAYHLGLTPKSLTRVLNFARNELGVTDRNAGTAEEVVSLHFLRTIYQHFPSTARRAFASHSAYCRALHSALREAGVEVEPAFDATSELLQKKSDRDAGRFTDVVTLGAVGLRYSIWLGVEKPIALEPDRTSAAVYISHEKRLEPLLARHKPVDRHLLEQVRRLLEARGG